jgi:hypothetical protein
MTATATSGGRGRAGWIVTGLVTAFLLFDAITKVLRVQPVLEACAKVGLDAGQVPIVGAILLACTTLYVVPRTRALGAVLLTGYLGGAVATHLRAGSSLFETVFPMAFGALAWLALVLRDPGIRAMIFTRD